MLQGAPNFRDLGGLPCAHGQRLRAGQLLRSDQLCDLTDTGLSQLAALRVGLLCDLRGEAERTEAPNRWPEGQAVRTLLAPALLPVEGARPVGWLQRLREPDFDAAAAFERMCDAYAAMPAAYAGVLGALLQHLAADSPMPSAPVLVHCVAGKDRTGFVCAMLLSALGAPQPVVLADYLASRPYQPASGRFPLRDAVFGPQASARVRGVRDVMTGVDMRFLQAALNAIERSHGGVQRYLQDAAGLDAPQQQRLQARLLIEPRTSSDGLAG